MEWRLDETTSAPHRRNVYATRPAWRRHRINGDRETRCLGGWGQGYTRSTVGPGPRPAWREHRRDPQGDQREDEIVRGDESPRDPARRPEDEGLHDRSRDPADVRSDREGTQDREGIGRRGQDPGRQSLSGAGDQGREHEGGGDAGEVPQGPRPRSRRHGGLDGCDRRGEARERAVKGSSGGQVRPATRGLSRAPGLSTGSTSTSLGLRQDLPLRPCRAREVQKHRLELDPDEIHVADPESLEFVRRELAVSIERVQDEHFLVARKDIGVRESRRRKRPRREMKLHARGPPQEATQLRQVRPVRFVQDDPNETARTPQRVEQEVEDLRRDGERTHAEDLAAAREDYFPELASNRFRPFVDPHIRLGSASLRGGALLETPDDLRRGDQVVASRLLGLLRHDPGRAGSVSIRPLAGHFDPALRLERLEDAIHGGILDPEELTHLMSG